MTIYTKSKNGNDVGFDVVTICGSMRCADEMLQVARMYTRQGKAVFVPVVALRPEQQSSRMKAMLDTMHRAKIDMADMVAIVMTEAAMPGDSTLAEMQYALEIGKPVTMVVCRESIATVELGVQEWEELLSAEHATE